MVRMMRHRVLYDVEFDLELSRTGQGADRQVHVLVVEGVRRVSEAVSGYVSFALTKGHATVTEVRVRMHDKAHRLDHRELEWELDQWRVDVLPKTPTFRVNKWRVVRVPLQAWRRFDETE